MSPTRAYLNTVALFMIALCGFGCQSANPSGRIESIMHRQAEQWNRGSIEGFMRYYVPGEALTFSSGGELRRGWDETMARYKRRYPDRAAMGRLSFTELETSPLGSRHALTLGRWQLTREDGDIGGAFSLVWRREGRRWLILHDHTTQSQPAP